MSTPAPVHSRATSARNGLRGVLLGLIGLAGATTAAVAGPSFDCNSPRTRSERLICASQDLSDLDRRISNAYRNASGALDAPGKSALRVDQHLFLESRDIQAQTDDYDMKADFEWRAKLLENIQPDARSGFTGLWANAYGEIRITPVRGGVFEVDIATVQPYPSFPVCQLKTSGSPQGTILVVGNATAAERDANDGWTVRLIRNGTALTAELQRPPSSGMSSPPFCGFRTSIDGDYLPVHRMPADPRFKAE
ncbi:hypothetical protein GCM10007301_24890 [Azorhizobium oxalatiphilum]|uniref:Lysozyme inhibitor LprI-like N-terminal domain-containing protein n=1 Tax=Azorhizobium oxalatiphilum TaxID=980631 RepID=A0A917FB53_9HYPH|nr:lysozyme inhibitor LprI family protein [Azorhizobium oxalatiphilum]GGF64079.1 hypothetical protein GCM10007301_24890 [Azorhizobium oxalatiphilum]